MTDLVDVTEQAPLAPSAPSSRFTMRIPIRVLTLVALTLMLFLLPRALRGTAMLPLSIGLPTVLWARLYRERLVGDYLYASGLGLITSLAAWAVVEFLLLLAHSGVNNASSAATLLIVCSVPLCLNSPWAFQRGVPLRAGRTIIDAAVLIALLVGGSAILGASIGIAEKHTDSQGAFAVFWIGLLLICIPLFLVIAGRTKVNASIVLVGLAVGTYLPPFLRSPREPLLSDEVAHWAETQRLLATGKLFVPDSVVTMGPRYPGLETLTAGITRLADVPTINAAHFVVLTCHIASLFGVAVLVRRLSGSGRAALYAAALYAISPSFLLIDAMFSYESLGIPIAIWLLVAAVETTMDPRGQLRLWLALTVFLSFALVMTHHLTSLELGGFLLVYGLIAIPWHGGKSAQSNRWLSGSPFILGLAILGGSVAWAFATQAPLVSYLGAFPRDAYHGLVDRFTGHTANTALTPRENSVALGAPRQLFGGSHLPGYEHVLSIGAQPLLFIWFAYAVWSSRHRVNPARLAFAILGLGYFVSLPFTFISGASAGAHRSWALSFVGVAATIALSVPRARNRFVTRGQNAAIAGLSSVALSVVLVGSYAAAVNSYQQFSGPFVLGADGRTLTPDMVRAATWFKETQGSGRFILTNRRTLVAFGSYGDARQRSFPQWTIFYPAGNPRAIDVANLINSGTDFVVVDARLATSVPIESYFASFEPVPPSIPLPSASLEKFDHLPWLNLIHRDGNISIYKIVRD